MTYVISDIHGRYDRYTALLECIDLRDEDTLYVLGDVIDRGPDGCKILLDMMARPNVLPILGNRVNPKFCVNSIWGANRAKFIQGGSR